MGLRIACGQEERTGFQWRGRRVGPNYPSAAQASFPTSDPIGESLTRHGMKRSKARRSKMSNLRVAQIAAALYASSVFCTRPSTMERHGDEMQKARETLSATLPLCPADGSLSAYFEFLFKLIDIWTPHRP